MPENSRGNEMKAIQVPGAFVQLGCRAIAIAALFLTSPSVTSASAQTLLKVAHDSPLASPYHVAAEWFEKEVERKTDGRVTVQIFPNAQLGDEETLFNGLKIGSVDVLYIATAPISGSVPEVDLFSLPFIFKDVDQALRVANGPLADPIEAKIEGASGAKLVAWASWGDRDMWNSVRPIKTVEDLRGLKMRTQQSAIQRDTYTALGAQPTPMAYSELFTALQTGVVDGADNGPLDIEQSKFYQVTKYISLTRHFILLNAVLVSKGSLAKLDSKDQAVIIEAARASADIMTNEAKQQGQAALSSLRKRGLEIFEIDEAERERFITRVQQVYDENANRVGGMDLIKKVLASR
jgi:tripartite ATP-independent transporter DctP family solute receptor